jgi:hypothetical protein
MVITGKAQPEQNGFRSAPKADIPRGGQRPLDYAQHLKNENHLLKLFVNRRASSSLGDWKRGFLNEPTSSPAAPIGMHSDTGNHSDRAASPP